MPNSNKCWDNFSSEFDSSFSIDNKRIAEPQIIKFIKKHKSKKSKLTVLDFGCGTGHLCKSLNNLGLKVTGIDNSKKMILIAKKHPPKVISYLLGGHKFLKKTSKKFDIITSLMVLQFIDDLTSLPNSFNLIMPKGGRLILVVVNPAFVKTCTESKVGYYNLKKDKNGMRVVRRVTAKISFKVFVRTASDYKKIFRNAGFELIESKTLPFPKNFAKKYGWKLPTDIPEFLFMAFKKAN